MYSIHMRHRGSFVEEELQFPTMVSVVTFLYIDLLSPCVSYSSVAIYVLVCTCTTGTYTYYIYVFIHMYMHDWYIYLCVYYVCIVPIE